jgi:hypothetical protein
LAQRDFRRARFEEFMGRKPRRAPQSTPDFLPARDQGTDVLPDTVRRVEEPRTVPPDSLPAEESPPDGRPG